MVRTARLPSPRQVVRALLLGVPAGAALFGAAVAFLGGASLPLLTAFWCAGALLAAGQAWSSERWGRRALPTVQPPAPPPLVDPEAALQARRLARERLVRQIYGPDRLGIPPLPPPGPEEAAEVAESADRRPVPSQTPGEERGEASPARAPGSTPNGPELPGSASDPAAAAPVPRKRGGRRKAATPRDQEPTGEGTAAAPSPRKRKASTRRRAAAPPADQVRPESTPSVVRAPGQPGSEVASPDSGPDPAGTGVEPRVRSDREPAELAVIEGGQA